MTSPAGLLAWLDWYRAMGAADWFGDRPVDRCQAAAPAAADAGRVLRHGRRAAASTPRRCRPRAAGGPAGAAAAALGRQRGLERARDRGRLPSVDEIEAALRTFDGCALKETAHNLCFADGNPAAE